MADTLPWGGGGGKDVDIRNVFGWSACVDGMLARTKSVHGMDAQMEWKRGWNGCGHRMTA